MIDNEFCFHKIGWDIPTTQQALNYYNSHKKEYSDWLFDNRTKIFLDTNVLINLYTISRSQRNQLLKFLTKNKERIFLTHQVSNEYLKHRLSKAQGIREAYGRLPAEYQACLDNTLQNIKKALTGFISFASKSIISDDLPDTSEHLQAMCDKLRQKFDTDQEWSNTLNESSAIIISDFKRECDAIISNLQYEYTDPILDVIAQLQVLPPLDQDEMQCIKALYDSLLDEFNKAKTDKTKKEPATFPGCGDRKKIADGEPPYGDFIIYHEMLKFIKEHPEDILFITRDITKSDWIKTDKRPFVHYIIDIYSHTGQMIYIIPANDFFPVSFTSLTSEPSQGTPADMQQSGAETVPEPVPDDNVKNSPEQPEPNDNAGDADSPLFEALPPKEIRRFKFSQSIQDYLSKQIFPLDLSAFSFQKSDGDSANDSGYLRDITPERFISELQTAIKWAGTYGNKYVSENLFIYDILKSKRFRFASSRRVLDDLIKDGTVDRKMEAHNDKTIPCLSLIKSSRKVK